MHFGSSPDFGHVRCDFIVLATGRALFFRYMPIANFWSFPKRGFTWPDRLTRRLLRRIGLLLCVGCLLELERRCVDDVAVAGNMSFDAKLVRLITKSYMIPARIFLASPVN